MVVIHVLRISKVPRVLGLDFQCTMSEPLPKSSELIFDSDVRQDTRQLPNGTWESDPCDCFQNHSPAARLSVYTES